MRILIISFFTDWAPHFGTELEIAQCHIDAGNQVEFLACDGGIRNCETNPFEDSEICRRCVNRRNRGILALSKKVKIHNIGDYVSQDALKQAESDSSLVRSAEDAKSFRYKEQDLGWGALSSTIGNLRDPFCESDTARAMLRNLTRTSILSYEAVTSFLHTTSGYDKAFLFNGRFASTRGAYRACRKFRDLQVILHERGATVEKYALFENDLLHTRNTWRRQIAKSWDSEPDLQGKSVIGRRFYEESRAGSAVGWVSFTDRQKKGLLPEYWDRSRHNIVIFNSSEDEFAAIGDEWSNHVYPMQCEGVRRIVKDSLARYPESRIYLRMHPNLRGVDNEDVRKLRSIQSPNFHLIEPDSPISTYSLIDACDKVVTFGSTVGIEAAFWGKPSIMAGHAFYEHLGSVYCAHTHEDVMTLIGSNLDPLPVEGALMYGYHIRTFGIQFRHWKPFGFFHGKFKHEIFPEPMSLFAYHVVMPLRNKMINRLRNNSLAKWLYKLLKGIA